MQALTFRLLYHANNFISFVARCYFYGVKNRKYGQKAYSGKSGFFCVFFLCALSYANAYANAYRMCYKLWGKPNVFKPKKNKKKQRFSFSRKVIIMHDVIKCHWIVCSFLIIKK